MTMRQATDQMKFWETISPHCAIETVEQQSEQLDLLSPGRDGKEER
jgi:hypothetical protein